MPKSAVSPPARKYRPKTIAGIEIPAQLVLPLESELTGRLSWLVHLRWGAALLVTLSGLWCTWYDVGIPGREVTAVGVTIALYNLLILLTLQRYLRNHILNANLQIGLDWLALLVLMHLTGGMHSPVLMFFIFHVLIAAILMPGRGCYWHSLIATVAIGMVGLLELVGVIPHIRPIWANLPPPGSHQLLVLVGFFGLSVFLCAFFASTISHHLRRLEQEQIDLQEKFAEAIQRLDAANQGLIAIDSQKSRYTHTVTHQLRGPLSAVHALLRVLVDGYEGEMNAKAMDIVKRVEARTVQLLDTVRDLLDFAGLDFEPREEQGEQVKLISVVSNLLEKYVPSADLRRIALDASIPDDLVILATEHDIELALDNLMGNAIKYSHSGGSVEVRGWQAEGQVHLSVRDHGIGISPEAQKQLFTEFYRAPNAKEHEPYGTGLGLVIVKRSVQRWGGSVSVQSIEGEGATFTLHFPQPQAPCS